ncbi:MAG: 2-dehydropantoate 2-reductase N-terminal domain-containing protein, partial [Marinobacter sp.]
MIAILGAGSLGRLWAATLPAGQVAFVPRPEQTPPSLHYRFRPIDGPEQAIEVPWLEPGQPINLLLVTTKAGDTLAALESTLPHLPVPTDTPIVLFQNGLGSQQQVAERWPDRPILAASTTEGANRPVPDVTIHAGSGETWIGALTTSAECRVAGAVQQL